MGTKYTVDNAGIVTLTNDLIVDTNVLKVDAAGNFVGINKTTPTVALDVVGAAALTGDLSVDTNVLKVDAAGNFVGINKTTPTVALDVVGAVTSTGTITGNALTITNNGQLGTLSLGAASPVASALIEMVSTTKGLLAPRMTTTERDAISSPASGLLIYNTTTTAFNYYNGATWAAVGTGGGGGGVSATYTRTSSVGDNTTTLFTTPTYIIGNDSLLVYNGGVLMTKTVDYTETSTTSVTFFTAPNTGAQLTFVVATAGTTMGYSKSIQTASGSAVFTVPTYTPGNGSLLVFKDGVLMAITADYSETSSTSVTMVSAPVTGATMTFIVSAIAYVLTPGTFTEVRQSFTATGGQTLFTLSTAYDPTGLNLKVYRNGQLQNPGAGNDYLEDASAPYTTFTMLAPQTAGDLLTAVYVVPAVALATPTIGTESRLTFTSTGSPQSFAITPSYLPGGKNLKVYVNGALQTPSTNYSEDNSGQISFATGLTAGDIVEAVWTGAAVGVISYTPATEIRQNFVATGAEAGLFALTGGTTFTQGGSNLKVYVDGVLMVLGGSNDYTEPSNSQVQFNAGNHPTVGQVVALIALTQTGALGNFQNRRDEFISTASQTVFSASFTFVMGGADMQVYNDGVLMKLGDDYYELNNTQIVFYVGRTLSSKVTLVSKIQAAAGDANSVNGISASNTPTAGKLFPLDGNGQIPASANVYAILAAL